jgi:hypothetical protein
MSCYSKLLLLLLLLLMAMMLLIGKHQGTVKA